MKKKTTYPQNLQHEHSVINIHNDSTIHLVNNSALENSYDNGLLHQVVKDAGRWAFGVVLVELWCLNEACTHLFRPDYGWWLDECSGLEEKLRRLIDPNLLDFLPAHQLPPGVGLPGYLWSQQRDSNPADLYNGSKRMLGGNILRSLSGHVSWCELENLANDPDQPHNPRLKFLAEAGLGLAAGVPFNMGGTRGIVIYMARKSVNFHKLKDNVNMEYLERSTMMIGSAYSLRKSRIALEKQRKEDIRKCFQGLVTKVKEIKGTAKSLKNVIDETESLKNMIDETSRIPSVVHAEVEGVCKQGVNYFVRKCRMETRKAFGMSIKAPPRFSWKQTFMTLLGSFVTLAILTNINKALINNYNSDYSLALPPFGALITLQFGLTAAPASQPRNIIIGQILSLCVAQVIGHAKHLELWLRQSVATSLAIAFMVKLGVTHPPAGAAALFFSSGNSSWTQVALMLMGNVIAIICATLINNWSDKRQYPTFWGLQPISEFGFYSTGETDKKDHTK